jgi:hypothetical protein
MERQVKTRECKARLEKTRECKDKYGKTRKDKRQPARLKQAIARHRKATQGKGFTQSLHGPKHSERNRRFIKTTRGPVCTVGVVKIL